MSASVRPVALFSATLGGGGAERVLVNLAVGMIAQGDAVDIVLAHASGKNINLLPEQARLVDLHVGRTLASLGPLCGYIRERRPKAIICFQDHATIIALWARMLARVATPIVGTVHSTWSRVLANGNWKTKFIASCARHAYSKVNSVVAVSEGAADDLAATLQLSREKIRVIYNPVITPELFLKSKEALQHPWFRRGSPPVILGIGRLTREKDFSNVIQAFAQVRREMECRLMILGEGEDCRELFELAKRLGVADDINFPGYVENPYKYLSHASLFVLSSRWEGLPTVLIEALAVGVPVVSTDCECGPREILKNGEYGELVPVGNSVALADAICRTLRTKSSCRGDTRRFYADEVTKQYRSLIDALANQNTKSVSGNP